MALNKNSVHLLTVQYGGGIMQVVSELEDMSLSTSNNDTHQYFPGGYLRLIRPFQIFASHDENGKVKVGLVPVDPFMDEKSDVWVQRDCVNTISKPSDQMYKAYSEARTGLALPSGVSQTPAGLHLVQ